jgi:serine O-acetyltransferase
MQSGIDRVAEHLAAQREMADPISQARKETNYDVRKVHETLDHLRRLVFDQTLTDQLRSDLQVVHGLVAGLIGVEKASRLIDQIPDVRHCVAMDVEAAFDRDPAAKTYAEVIASYPSALAVPSYRLAHAFYELGEHVVARIMGEWAHQATGIDIHPGAQIGCHFFIDHGTGVVVGETCEIGNRVKLYHGVTLGAFSNRHGRDDVGRKRHPTIEDDVTIYPNATILGGRTVVGAGSIVGGNAWITRSVPPLSRVMIEPPRLQVRKQEDAAELEVDYEL